VPAAAVIPAEKAYTNIVAVKTLVVGIISASGWLENLIFQAVWCRIKAWAEAINFSLSI
jgi:hypothetical protein